MEGFVKGEVVVVPFPFSDLSDTKRRPALVLTDLPGDEVLLCQITSQQGSYSDSIVIELNDFHSGSLPLTSYIKPYRIFTADKNIIIRKTGILKTDVIDSVIEKIINLLR